MAEAVDDVGEFRGDRRIDMDVDVAGDVDVRRDLTGELFEHHVLVLRLGAELGGLEHALAVPLVGGMAAVAGGRSTVGRSTPADPFVRERRVAVVQLLLDRAS